MEGVACPVSHVVEELVVCHYNIRVLSCLVAVAEISAIDLNYTTYSTNVVSEGVSGEDDRPLVAFDEEGRDLLILIHDLVVVELQIRVD